MRRGIPYVITIAVSKAYQTNRLQYYPSFDAICYRKNKLQHCVLLQICSMYSIELSLCVHVIPLAQYKGKRALVGVVFLLNFPIVS